MVTKKIKNTAPQLGYTGKIIVFKSAYIHERIARIAYPRNGNAYNPTVYKEWDIYLSGHPGNSPPYLRCQTLKEAKRVIAEGDQETTPMTDTKRIRTGQYEYTVNGIAYEIHEVERSEGFSRPLWNVRRKGGRWFDSARTLREAKMWAEVDAGVLVIETSNGELS